MLERNEWSNSEEAALLKLKEKKLSYLEISEIMGKTPDSLRVKYWRLKREKNKKFEQEAKILVFDIESSLSIFSAFSTGYQYLSYKNLIQDYYLVSWGAKWLGEDEVYSDVLTSRESKKGNDKRILKGLWKLIDEADIVIGHNSDKFDLKKVNTRFILNGMSLPRPPDKTIDTLKLARKVFSFSSNRLDDLCKMFNLKAKEGNEEGYELWLKCLKGNKQALIDMENYNRNDVVITENLYHILKKGLYSGIKEPREGWKSK